MPVLRNHKLSFNPTCHLVTGRGNILRRHSITLPKPVEADNHKLGNTSIKSQSNADKVQASIKLFGPGVSPRLLGQHSNLHRRVCRSIPVRSILFRRVHSQPSSLSNLRLRVLRQDLFGHNTIHLLQHPAPNPGALLIQVQTMEVANMVQHHPVPDHSNQHRDRNCSVFPY